MTVSASEFPPRTIATTPAPRPDDEAPHLRDDVVALARALPGELRRLTVRDGDRDVRPAAGPDPAAAAPEVAGSVRSPLVGTFYTAPSPGADPFVRVGDEVEAGQTVGIVEAMKLMNPIVVDEAGVIAEILVGDTESVEYDQVLMRLRPPGRSR